MKKLSRGDLLKGCARGGVLAGILGLCAVLNNREEKFECDNRCGRCSKNNNGICALGLK
ncbi:hypothetical protein P4B35_00720 [Pontiellaceae bacterium B12227]|nr:hypothetical protein [Pontiellaceae bacterium B12227]